MYVSVHHVIKDPASFQTRGQQLRQERTDGLKAMQFLPDQQGRRAACPWEGPTLESVLDLIDGCLGDASEQEYFTVSEQHAFGVPATQNA